MVDFSANGSVGLGGGSPGVRQGLYTNSTTQKGTVGSKMEFESGEIFRYCYYVTAVTAGKLAALDQSVAIQSSFDAAFTDSAGTAKDDYGTDDNQIYVKTSDITSDDTANIWADGWLMITDAAGEGLKYKIKGHEAGSATTANVMRLDLYDNLAVALDSESSACIIGSRYSNLAIAGNSAADQIVIGIPTVAAAATSYNWTQVDGTSLVLADENAGTISFGVIAQLSDGVDGAAQPFGGGATNSESDHSYDTEPIIGTFLTAAVDTEYVAIDLRIE